MINAVNIYHFANIENAPIESKVGQIPMLIWYVDDHNFVLLAWQNSREEFCSVRGKPVVSWSSAFTFKNGPDLATKNWLTLEKNSNGSLTVSSVFMTNHTDYHIYCVNGLFTGLKNRIWISVIHIDTVTIFWPSPYQSSNWNKPRAQQ